MGLLDISLTSSMRSTLFSLKDTSAKIERAQERLATGKKVMTALDNPTNYFAAQAHLNRAGDLIGYKDGILKAAQVLKAADIGMTSMTSIFRQASAIAENAMQARSLSELQNYVNQFNEMRKQADTLSADSSYSGANLLHRQDLTINFDNDSSLVIKGADVTSSGFDQMTNGLGVEEASMDPLNIVDPNYVLTSSGVIKSDGVLTITNNDVAGIDNWLGVDGIKNQIITSQDVALSTAATSFSDGRIVTSQILDNVGVAEYGTGGFELYRDTSASIIDGAGYASSISAIANPDYISRYLGPLQSSGSKAFSIQKTPDISGYHVITGVAGSLSPPPTIDDSAKVAAYLEQPTSVPYPIFKYNSLTQQWSVLDSSPILLVQSGTPPTSLGLDLDGTGVPAVTINLSGVWSDNDQIQIALSSWSTADPDVHVMGNGDSTGISINFGSITDQATVFSFDLNTSQNNIPTGTNMTFAVNASTWKATDPSIVLNQPTGTGAMTADLNDDGSDDIQVNLPTDGPNGAAWLSNERVQISTTGAFRTTDPMVHLDYDHDLKTIALSLAGGGGTDITINLSGTWAVNHLPTDPTGNGDAINLTVDGRHRWVKGDGVTPNAPGMRLSMSEIEDAIRKMRAISAQNSANANVLTVREEFTQNIANVLQTGADNLTLADMNEEGANMLMLQTRQNLGITSLSMAGQTAQSVMKLF